MIEVIYNSDLPASEQYFGLVELTSFPTSDRRNRGTLNTGAGSSLLMMAYEELDYLNIYLMCGYMSHLELPEYDVWPRPKFDKITDFCVPNNFM